MYPSSAATPTTPQRECPVKILGPFARSVDVGRRIPLRNTATGQPLLLSTGCGCTGIDTRAEFASVGHEPRERGMESIRVAAVSMNGWLGQPERVLSDIAAWCGRAVAERAELVLFPELVIHGHCTPNTAEVAELVPDGPSVKRLIALARQHGLVVSAGLSERERDIIYNTQVLVGPDGYIGKQRKLHLSRDEVIHYTPGRTLDVFDIGKCKIGISICYDTEFPELP